jgi:hypothetical protein
MTTTKEEIICKTYSGLRKTRVEYLKNTYLKQEQRKEIQYRYGPNYREQHVPAKPSNNRYDKGELQQYDQLRNFAEVMKEKRNSSSIFY